jgi:Xaa-Pro aminopeptidase
VQVFDYEEVFNQLGNISSKYSSIVLGKKVAYSGGASFAIYNLISEDKLKFKQSPVMLMKSQKNEVEIQGMDKANIKDAVAVVEMAAKLEEGMANGEEWTELKVSKKLENFRSQQEWFKGPSFYTISAYGPNGAVIHYKPNNLTNAKIGTDSFFLLDSGER